MPTPEHVETAVLSAVLEVARRVTPNIAAVQLHQKLIGELGLTSLDLAELVAILEVELGHDPFATDAVISDIRTVGDLVTAYRG